MSSTALPYTIDLTQFKPNTGRPEPIPPGWYNVIFINAENKPTKDTVRDPSINAYYAEFTLKVIDGPHAGYMLTDRLNLWNPNPTAVDIAQGTLAQIGMYVGVFQVNDWAVFFNKPLMARVTHKPASGNYDASNEVKGYDKTGARQPSTGAPPMPTATSNGPPTFTPPTAPAGWAPPAAAPTPAAAPVFTPPPGVVVPPSSPPFAAPGPVAGGHAPITPPWKTAG